MNELKQKLNERFRWNGRTSSIISYTPIQNYICFTWLNMELLFLFPYIWNKTRQIHKPLFVLVSNYTAQLIHNKCNIFHSSCLILSVCLCACVRQKDKSQLVISGQILSSIQSRLTIFINSLTNHFIWVI